MNLDWLVLPEIPELDFDTEPKVIISNFMASVEFENSLHQRCHLFFKPIQAVKYTTSDCFLVPEGKSIVPRRVLEVTGSAWISELAFNLSIIDRSANFMDSARHFVIPLPHDFLEVVSWNIAMQVKT